MSQISPCSPYQFALFRSLFGLFLFGHFAYLIPYAGELFAREGMLNDSKLNPTYGQFPNILYVADSGLFAMGFCGVLTLLSLLFALGVLRRWVALVLWYGWACLFHANNFISDPAIYFVGWLLLACCIVPEGEPALAVGSRRAYSSWAMPSSIYAGAWVIFAASYTVSGLDKLITSPSWGAGLALQYVLETPLARPSFLRDAFLSLPVIVIQLATWTILAIEVLAGPLSLSRKTRPLVWAALSLMHLGILLLLSFPDLTVGMLMFHLFVIDARWFRPKPSAGFERIVFVDGTCRLCTSFGRFVATEDQAGIFDLSTLQGEAARSLLGERGSKEITTVVLKDEFGVHAQSEAVLRILSGIGGIWGPISWLRIVPRPIRDALYDFVAVRRFRWFGQNQTCALSIEGCRDRFVA